jgi:hypothetical protein
VAEGGVIAFKRAATPVTATMTAIAKMTQRLETGAFARPAGCHRPGRSHITLMALLPLDAIFAT